MKNNKGITLVALVVTIIVLIILALISMNAIFGEDGIIKRAEQARDMYKQGEKNDLDAIGSISDEIGEALGETKEVILKVGDYVDYKPTNGTFAKETLDTYSGSTENTALSTDNSLNWRILEVDSTTLTLISAVPTSEELYLAYDSGYSNGVLLLNNICKTNYSNSTLNATARSIKIEDIEKATGYSGSTYVPAGPGKEEEYPSIFLSEAYGSANGSDFGTLERSDQEEYILSAIGEGSIKAKETHYRYEIKEDSVDSKYVELLGYKPRNYRLS